MFFAVKPERLAARTFKNREGADNLIHFTDPLRRRQPHFGMIKEVRRCGVGILAFGDVRKAKALYNNVSLRKFSVMQHKTDCTIFSRRSVQWLT